MVLTASQGTAGSRCSSVYIIFTYEVYSVKFWIEDGKQAVVYYSAAAAGDAGF